LVGKNLRIRRIALAVDRRLIRFNRDFGLG
jgi:hypothetical protein